MPTIDQLAVATAASDDDELAVSQGGIVRRVTRSQLLAGLQPALALPAGTLLGRASLGPGGPESVAVGANLTLSNGTLAAGGSFNIPSLTPGGAPAVGDLVVLAQGGVASAVPYGQFMSGLASVPGIDASALNVRSAGSTTRPLSEALRDAVSVEQFGAVGDGATDDTNAFESAVASGYPLLLGPRTYMISGQWTVTQAAVLIGVPGLSILRRRAQVGSGAWILFEGPYVQAEGVVFDANGSAIQTESWGILVSAAQSSFRSCVFANSVGQSLGCGLTIQTNSGAGCEHRILSCDAFGNAAHGIWAQAVSHVEISGCIAHDNGGYGIVIDYTDPTFTNTATFVQVTNNQAYSNIRGISVGNYNESNAQPPTWGLGNPDVVNALIANNICHGNQSYGLAVSGRNLAVVSNSLIANGTVSTGGAGILANASSTLIAANMVAGPGQFGIDSGGSTDLDIVGNHISGFAVGLNPGGSQNVRISANMLLFNQWGITVYNVETDGSGGNFGLAARQITIEGNSISFVTSTGGGIYLIDGPQGVAVRDNTFAGSGSAMITQALWPLTDNVEVEGNRWNGSRIENVTATSTANGSQLIFADMADEVFPGSTTSAITSVQSALQCQMVGQVAFIKLQSGGSGYTQASVIVSGIGSGASAIAYVYKGAVVGISMTANGAGYGPAGTQVGVIISGDGVGAQATAVAGLPLVDGRKLTISVQSAITLASSGSSPAQMNWTQNDITLPPQASAHLSARGGSWMIDGFPPSSYLAPGANGSLTLQTPAGGDLQLHPKGQSQLRFLSDAEPVGCVSCIGRGSPEGVVTAPPGSDFRNLSGGIGSTFWIKQAGTGPSGWLAIA